MKSGMSRPSADVTMANGFDNYNRTLVTLDDSFAKEHSIEDADLCAFHFNTRRGRGQVYL